MPRLICCVMLFAGLLGMWLPAPVLAWSWGERVLVTVNGTQYTATDFSDWWANWQEEGMTLPETPEPFIDWVLLAQEAEKMQLDRDPGFLAKVETFLKVRALMLLKSEEVDRKVSVADAEAWKLYEQEYCPRWLLNIFVFSEEKGAAAKADDLREKRISVKELAEAVNQEDGPQYYQSLEVREKKLDESWRKALAGAVPGTVSAPIVMPKGVVVLQLDSVLAPDKEDFHKARAGIIDILKKEKSAELTARLVASLEKKFAVRVDEELLKAVGEDAPVGDDAKKILIQTNRDNIDVGAFWTQLEKEKKFRKQFHFAAKDQEAMKKNVLGNIISQTLISWEAMDRHYEEKEPFKKTYQFYRRHRLTKEIEKRFVQPKAELAAEETQRYYDTHPELFTQPEMVSIALLDGEKGFIEKVWGEVLQGRDFFEIAREKVHGGAPVRRVPLDHLDEQVRLALAPLRKGEISKPFAHGESMALVKLMGQQEKKLVPLAAIKEKLEMQLRQEKYEQAKRDFLQNLKSLSEIAVDGKEWGKVRRELEKTKDSAKNS
ncbi:peptidylprolyl isomerase [Thiovibrio sp. JS02]